MAESKITDLIRIVNDLHKEFVKNDFTVSESMVDDLWLIFGDDGVEEAESKFTQFSRQLNTLVEFKILGGLKEAFIKHLELKKIAQRVSLNSYKKSDAYLSVKEAVEEYEVSKSSWYRFINKQDPKPKFYETGSYKGYYRRDLEVILIDEEILESITEKTKTIEEKFFGLEEKVRRHMRKLNKE